MLDHTDDVRAPAPSMPATLRVSGIRKVFGTVRANDGIDAEFRSGQIHALLGENGAGKSTLIKILCGIYHADEGEIRFEGEVLEPGSTAGARQHGIAVVHQHSSLIGRLTIAENIRLVGPVTGSTGGDLERFLELGELLGFEVDPSRVVDTLTTGDRQRVEIAREMIGRPRVLILDEPTATLAPAERVALFDMLRRLADLGAAIVFVTHRLEEATQYCDAVTILRAGRTVFEHQSPGDLSKADLVRAMVGEIRLPQKQHVAGGTGRPLLSATGVRHPGTAAGWVIEIDDLVVHESEILGIAGVEGNGQSDLASLLAGEATCPGIRLAGDVVSELRPAARVQRIAHVPDDESLAFSVQLTVWENMFAEEMLYRRARTPRAKAQMRRQAVDLVERFHVRPPAIEALGGQLSGGNRRRVQIAREFTKPAQLVVCNYVTRGLDIRSIEQVKAWCRELADAGAAVVYIASDLEEILDVSDTVAVLARGRLTESRPVAQASTEWIGHSMLGTHESEEPSP